MNKSRIVLVVSIMVAMTACQFLSVDGSPVSEPGSNDAPDIRVNGDNVDSGLSEDVEKYFDTSDVPGEPEDYGSFCDYGSILIRQPFVDKDREYDDNAGRIPMKPNSWAQLQSTCFPSDNNYIKKYDTTLSRDLVFSFYRVFFDQAGYTPSESLPDSLANRKIVEWIGYGNYKISFFIYDWEVAHPDEPQLEGIYTVDITLTLGK